MSSANVTAERMPNGHIQARIAKDGKPYEFVLESIGSNQTTGYLLAGEDQTSIEVVADLDKDEICIGNLCFRTSLAVIREVVADGGPAMTGDQVQKELDLATQGQVWDLVDAGDLVVVGQNKKRQRLIGAASVMRMKGHTVEPNTTMTYEEAGKYLGLDPHTTIPARIKRGDLVQVRKGIGVTEARQKGVSVRKPLVSRASVEAFKGTPEHDRALHFAARAAKRLITQAANKAKAADAPPVVEEEPQEEVVEEEQAESTPAPSPKVVETSSRAWGRLSGIIEGMVIMAGLTPDAQARVEDAVADVENLLRERGLTP